jgi:hypothetical protein
VRERLERDEAERARATLDRMDATEHRVDGIVILRARWQAASPVSAAASDSSHSAKKIAWISSLVMPRLHRTGRLAGPPGGRCPAGRARENGRSALRTARADQQLQHGLPDLRAFACVDVQRT